MSRNTLGYCVPFPGSDRSVVIRSQLYRYTHSNEYPVQFEAYFCVPTWQDIAKLVMVNVNLLLFSSMPSGDRLLKKYSHIFSLGTFDRDRPPQRESLMKNRFQLTLVGRGWPHRFSSQEAHSSDNMVQTDAVQVNGGDVAYIDTASIATRTALLLVDQIKQGSNRVGVLTPASALDHDQLLPLLEEEGIHFHFISNYKL